MWAGRRIFFLPNVKLVVHTVTTGPWRIKKECPIHSVCFQNMFNVWNHFAWVCHGLLLHFVSKRDRGPLNTESDQLAFKNKVYFYYVCWLKDDATLEACIQIPTAVRSCIYFIGSAHYNGSKIKRSKIRSAFIKRSDSGPKQQRALCILCMTLAPLPFTIDP